MRDPLASFNWSTLHGDYDAICRGFDGSVEYLDTFNPRPVSDRELYYRLVERFSAERPKGIKIGTYEAMLYWKLYSQPAAVANVCGRIHSDMVIRKTAISELARFSAILPFSLNRRLSEVVTLLPLLDGNKLHGLSTRSSLPVRTTFLHFIYPDVVPIFDKQVLLAVGVNKRNANRDPAVLRQYIPHAWQLVNRHSPTCATFSKESNLRVLDMALWVVRGRIKRTDIAGTFTPEKPCAARNHTMFKNAFRARRGQSLTTSQIKEILLRAYPNFVPGSVLPNDHAGGNKSCCACAGTENRLFDRIEHGLYRVR